MLGRRWGKLGKTFPEEIITHGILTSASDMDTTCNIISCDISGF